MTTKNKEKKEGKVVYDYAKANERKKDKVI